MTENVMTEEVSPTDPRFGFAMVTSALHDIIAGAADQPDKPTPCEEFDVKGLLNHMLMVQQRVAVIGAGGQWSDIQDPQLTEGWSEAFKTASHDVRMAWDNPELLEKMVDVPWGSTPGGAALMMYTGELAVHGWDLATATGQSFSIDDDHLRGAHQAAMFIPAEGRDDPAMPFGEVVAVPDDAPLLHQIAGWWGRDVS